MIERIRNILGDNKYDDVLINEIINITNKQLLNKISEDIVPKELEYIVLMVCIKRLNKLGSEGMKSESVDGLNINYEDDVFKEFEQDINNYLSEKNKDKNKVVFL